MGSFRQTIFLGLGCLPVLMGASRLNAQCVASEQFEVAATTTASWDQFSTALTIQGDVAVVGAPLDDDLGSTSGSAFVFRRNGGVWAEEATLQASDGAAGAFFGTSVSLDGDVIVVGAFGDASQGTDSGAAYVFRRVGASWIEEQKLVASDAATLDRFGSAVAVSADAILVGAHQNDDACPLDPACDSGSGYVFRFDGASWSEEQKLLASDMTVGDQLGRAVTLDGDVAVLGTPEEIIKGGTEPGAAYVYRFDGTSWAEEIKLQASDLLVDDRFGTSVSLSGDTLLVGADGHASGAGAAYVFRHDGINWSEEAKLSATPSNFGRSVALLDDAALIGAPSDAGAGILTGVAWLFRREGTTWSEDRGFLSSDIAPFDQLGIAVALDTDVALVGALTDDAGVNSGSAYFFSAATLALTAEPAVVSAGDLLSIATVGGAPGNPSLLFLVAVNGQPFVLNLGLIPLDATGAWTLANPVPADPSLPGNDLTFQTFVLNCAGRIEQSNSRTVSFQ